MIKKDNIYGSYKSELYENLNTSTQNNLDEKTCCLICLQRLNEKPYYCYNCHKLYCDGCFKKLEIVEKKKCQKCKTDNISGKEICQNCHENNEIEYTKCCHCSFLMDKICGKN